MSAPIVVKKFGGSMLNSTDSLKVLADHIQKHQSCWSQLIVLSAFYEETNELLRQSYAICPNISDEALSLLLTTGEQKALALMGAELESRGLKVAYFASWQIPIISQERLVDANVVAVDPIPFKQAIDAGKIVLIAGFQGITEKTRSMSTLGRGGSDTTACAIATALGALCIFYKDVGGVFNLDPKKHPEAQLLPTISVQEAFEIAHSGARILHEKAANMMCAQSLSALFTDLHHQRQTRLTPITSSKIHSINLSKEYFRLTSTQEFPWEFLSRNKNNLEIVSISKDKIKNHILFKKLNSTRMDSHEATQFFHSQENFIESLECVEIIGTGLKVWPSFETFLLRALKDLHLNVQNVIMTNFKVLVFVGDKHGEQSLRALSHLYDLRLKDEQLEKENDV